MKKKIMIRIEDTLHERAKKLSEVKFGKVNFCKWIESKIKEDDTRAI